MNAHDRVDSRKLSANTYLGWMETMDSLMAQVRGCRACGDALPLGARPVLQVSATARVLIASQAPGSRAHDSGIPFSDASGDRLREWTGLTPDIFYDASRIAIVPMGLCYPGRLPGGGDAPPRRECAPLWRERLLTQMPGLRLTLLVGTYAQTHILGRGKMTDRVIGFKQHMPAIFPLPHPSWRVQHWAARNPWFETDALPALRRAIRDALG